MPNKNFTQFDLRSPVLTSDYIVGYSTENVPVEYKTQLKEIVSLVGQSVTFDPQDKLLRFSTGEYVDLIDLSDTAFSILSSTLATQSDLSSVSSILVPLSIYQEVSGNWESTYNVVSELSSSWEESEDIIPAVQDYLGTSYVYISSLFVKHFTINEFLSTQTFNSAVSANEIFADIVYTPEGNSNRWNNIYSLVQANSAQWAIDSTIDTGVRELTAEWQDTTTVVQANSAQWAIDSTIDTGVRALTSNWEDTYSIVQSNSASWEESADILPTVTNYLSTNNVLISSLSVDNSLTITGNISGNNLRTSFNQGRSVGNYSFAVGTGKSFGNYSHAEGLDTMASGQGSHSEGQYTIASGIASHAAGTRTTAAQDYTYAWSDGNLGTATTNLSTTRSGQYMVSASGGMFIPGNVGIGTDNNLNALTVNGTLSAKNITSSGGLSATSHITTSGKFYGEGSSITNAVVTGKTIYVDANTGTDTRETLSKYSAGSPFATIAAAVAASVSGDLVWVRKGSYAIASTISLNGKGDIQCEAGTTINVVGNITAFSTSETKTVIGDVFVLADTAKLVVISGGTLRFEFASISSTSTGTLFTVTAGTIDTSFAYIVATSARAFELTGTGSMRIRRSHSVSCQQFLYANTTGGATIDLWTVVGNSPDTVFYIDNIAGLSYRGVNCNGSAGQNSYVGGYQGPVNWITNLGPANFVITSNSIQLNSTGGGEVGYAINTTQAQITSPSRYSFSSKLKWNASRLEGTPWYGPAGLILSDSSDLGGNYLFIGLQPVLDDTWARPSIAFKLGESDGTGIVYTDSTWSGFTTTLNENGAIRLQDQSTPAVITVVKTSKESLRVVINSPLDGDRIITIKFTTQEAIDAFASFNRFGYVAYLSDWTFSDQVIEGNLAPTFFFNYPQSTAGGGPISEINPVLRNIRISVANPRTPATILTTNAQRYFYLDNVRIASWDNRLSIDSLDANTNVVAYDVYSNRPVGSNIAVTGDLRQISTIF